MPCPCVGVSHVCVWVCLQATPATEMGAHGYAVFVRLILSAAEQAVRMCRAVTGHAGRLDSHCVPETMHSGRGVLFLVGDGPASSVSERPILPPQVFLLLVDLDYRVSAFFRL